MFFSYFLRYSMGNQSTYIMTTHSEETKRQIQTILQKYVSGTKGYEGNGDTDLLSGSDTDINDQIDKEIENILIKDMAPKNIKHRIIKKDGHRLLIKDARDQKEVPNLSQQKNRSNKEQYYALLISLYRIIKSYNQIVSFLQNRYEIKGDDILDIISDLEQIKQSYNQYQDHATINEKVAIKTKNNLVTLTRKILDNLNILLDPIKRNIDFDTNSLLNTVYQFNNMDYNAHLATIYPKEINGESRITIDVMNTHFIEMQKKNISMCRNFIKYLMISIILL